MESVSVVVMPGIVVNGTASRVTGLAGVSAAAEGDETHAEQTGENDLVQVPADRARVRTRIEQRADGSYVVGGVPGREVIDRHGSRLRGDAPQHARIEGVTVAPQAGEAGGPTDGA